MSNPFVDLFGPAFKSLHKQLIDALLDEETLTVACTVYYGGTKFTACPNCLPDNFTGKSSNVYNPGGPIPFSHGVCPHCNGTYKVKVEATDTVYLMPIWDARKWLKQALVNTADVKVQTLSKITTYSALKRASKIKIDNALEGNIQQEFTRVGEGQPISFGGTHHVVFSWTKSS